MESLSVKYRPQSFDTLCGQNSIKKILMRQLETKQFNNCYLFCGPSGCGKTTVARIFAHKINEYIYSVIRNDSFKMPDYGTEKSLFCRVKIIVGFSNKLIKRI